jgi:hypothetical protein
MARKTAPRSPGSKGSGLGQRLLSSLTQDEAAHLLDALLPALPPATLPGLLSQLPKDTAETIRRLLEPPGKPAPQDKKPSAPVASVAKLQQTWSELWDEWDEIVAQAGVENGPYWEQEEPWEAPYLDEYAVAGALEQVAERMLPLLPAAIEHGLKPKTSFGEAVARFESKVVGALPEWMEIVNGFSLEPATSRCVVTWEVLLAQKERRSLYSAALAVRRHEEKWRHTGLDADVVADLLLERPEAERRTLWEELQAASGAPPWKDVLERQYSAWRPLYLELLEQFDPAARVDQLEAGIAQDWADGLEVLEHWLGQGDLKRAGQTLEAMLRSLLHTPADRPVWRPDESLLAEALRRMQESDVLRLLELYRDLAQRTGQTRIDGSLEVQIVAWKKGRDWKAMLEALSKPGLPAEVRKKLTASWKNEILGLYQDGWFYGAQADRDGHWVEWLLESLLARGKGGAGFGAKLERWLAGVSGSGTSRAEDVRHLRRLTADVAEILGHKALGAGPKFFDAVVRPAELSTPDDASRRLFLTQALPKGLAEKLMACWKRILPSLVPRPERVERSDYSRHARWMAALRELAPERFAALLETWRQEHPKRKNLWAALQKHGIH